VSIVRIPEIRHQDERHAEFWELLWTVIATVSLVLMFLLLHMRLAR